MGTQGKLGGRQAEVTAKIKLGSGSVSCRPLELLNSLPAALPANLDQVFIITVGVDTR